MCRNNIDWLFKGLLDEVGIWNGVLTQSDVDILYNSGSGFPYENFQGDNPIVNNLLTNLQAYWKCEEASGTPAIDTHASYNSVSNNTTSAIGKLNNSFEYNGSSQYVSFGDVLNFDWDIPFSFSAWVKRDVSGTMHTIVSKMLSSDTYRGYMLNIRGSSSPPENVLGLTIRTDNAGYKYIMQYGKTTITDTNWHHVAFTYDGSHTAAGTLLYLDGVDDTDYYLWDQLDGTIVSTAPLCLGVRNESSLYHDGKIDEVGFWDRVLEPTDITLLYNSGAGLPYESFL
jgi:hypothetical protein